MKTTATQPAALLNWMDSLADATRLRLLHLLEKHELGVVDLCEVLQMPQSTVSRHLKVLGDQGWVLSRRQATTNLYFMPNGELPATARKLWTLAREQTDDWATLAHDALRLERRLTHRTGDARAFFAGAAGQWDKLRRELYGDRFMNAAVLALLPSHWTIADLGCGTGQIAAELSPCVHKIIGIDNSSAMLKAAAKRTKGLKNVELREGELTALPIKDATCDAAILALVLTYIPEPAAALREMRRIIKPGGKAVIIDLLRHDRDNFRRDMEQVHLGFQLEYINHELTAAGFDSVVVRALPPEPEARGPAIILAYGNAIMSGRLKE